MTSTAPVLLHPFPLKPLSLLCALTMLSLHASAQTAEPATDTEATPRFDIGRVDVRTTRRPALSARQLLTSVDTLHRDMIETQPAQAAWELFSLVPGALLTPFQQGTTSGKVSLRGFNGEGEVNAVKLLIDGVPANSHNGNMPYLDAVLPIELESIEVVRGTSDARHGLHAIAGSIDLRTRRGGNGTTVRLGAGSFGQRSAEVRHAQDSQGVQLDLAAGRKTADGWRDHARSTRQTLAASLTQADGGWSRRLSLRYFEHEAQEPGYLTRSVADTDPSSSPGYVGTDGGLRRTAQAAIQLDGTLSPELGSSSRFHVNHFSDDRWVRFSESVSQQERLTDETHVGAATTLSWRPRIKALHDFALQGGVDIESQDNISQRYTTADRVRGTQTRDQAYTLHVAGVHAQALVQPTPALRLVPGWRLDRVAGHFTNRLTGVESPVNDYGTISQPKMSLLWQVQPQLALHANWGRTFQIGTEAAAYKIPPRQADLKPSINQGWEAGLRFTPDEATTLRLAVWQQTATDEVRRRLNDPSGDSDNIGATRRRGADLQLRLLPAATLELWGALTLQKAIIVTPDPSAPATRGKEIDHVPRRLVQAGVNWTPHAAWRLSAELQSQGDYFLERTNSTGRFGGFTVLNLGASWQCSPRLRLEAWVRNATDRRTEYVWHDGTQSLHSPGAPRSVSLALRSDL